MNKLTLIALFLSCFINIYGQNKNIPTGLRTDLMEFTDRVNINGEISQLRLEETSNIVEPVQIVLIENSTPSFSWMIQDDRQNINQEAFQIQLSESRDFEQIPLWDSQKRITSTSQVKYSGGALKPNSLYFWRVKQWNNLGEESDWSHVKAFRTSGELKSYASGHYSISQQDQPYLSRKNIDKKTQFYDFGKAAFGRVKFTFDSKAQYDTLTLRLGECITSEGRIDSNPGGSRRFREIRVPLQQGRHTYTVAITKDSRNTRRAAIPMPEYIGDVLPFRYCEIESEQQQPEMVIREVVTYTFNDHASYFNSSDTLLNAIWDFCKYSIKATSFTGYYVDGDRERIPYEADVYINQLCHYAVDNEYTLGRRTTEFLIFNPTWPTEWILSTVLLAWIDYLYTGNEDLIRTYYSDLQKKALTTLTEENGLISTRTGKLTDEVKRDVHYSKPEVLRDIVDWPHKGTFGMSGDNSGETDGFEFTDYNTVVNAYHNKALQVMSEMAKAIGKTEDSEYYSLRAEEHRRAFNKLFFDKKKGYYNDGIDTDHSSLHANMFALAFDLVPERYLKSVTDFVKTRGMACSVYGSQHLLNAVYAGEDAEYGLDLLTSRTDRGWAHAIYDVGTTITLEAWDNKYKPNQDWNHAWGAAPANIIPMQLMGVQPLAAGFSRFMIKPQIGDLQFAELRYPTIKGSIELKIENKDSFTMQVAIPANTSAEVWIPKFNKLKQSVLVNGKKVSYTQVRNFIRLNQDLGSGQYVIELN